MLWRGLAGTGLRTLCVRRARGTLGDAFWVALLSRLLEVPKWGVWLCPGSCWGYHKSQSVGITVSDPALCGGRLLQGRACGPHGTADLRSAGCLRAKRKVMGQSLSAQSLSQESVSLPLMIPSSGSPPLPPGDVECQAATGPEAPQAAGRRARAGAAGGGGAALRHWASPAPGAGRARGRLWSAGPGMATAWRRLGILLVSPPAVAAGAREAEEGREGGRAALAHLGGGAELGVDARGREEKGCGCGAASRLVRGARRRRRGGTRAAWGSRAARGRPRRFAAAEAAARGRCGRGASHAGGEVAGGCAVPPRPARRQVVGVSPPPGTR